MLQERRQVPVLGDVVRDGSQSEHRPLPRRSKGGERWNRPRHGAEADSRFDPYCRRSRAPVQGARRSNTKRAADVGVGTRPAGHGSRSAGIADETLESTRPSAICWYPSLAATGCAGRLDHKARLVPGPTSSDVPREEARPGLRSPITGRVDRRNSSPAFSPLPGDDLMTEPKPSTTRRDFLKTTGQVAAASALAGVAIPSVHAGEDNTIQVALVGCGGRGTGAAGNALSTKSGPIKLVAMADVFEDRLDSSYKQLKKAVRRQGRRARRPQVHRLRRLQEGDGLPASRATSSSSPRRRPSAGCISTTPSRRASTSSWRSRSPSTARRTPQDARAGRGGRRRRT